MNKFKVLVVAIACLILTGSIIKISGLEINIKDAQISQTGSQETSSAMVSSEKNETQKIGNIIEKDMAASVKVTELGEIILNNQTKLEIDTTEYFYKPLEFTIDKDSDEPQILIMHTHTTESYILSENGYYTDDSEPRTTELQKNVAAVGKAIAEQIEAAGFSVIHDTTLHDYPGYTGSYSRSAKTVKQYLEKYPSIKIVIDLHRDAISANDNSKIAPTTVINGKKAAQIMLVMGSNSGNITDHPNWEQNLSLAVKLQNTINIMYPSLSRSILLRSSKYNQHLSTGSILIEVGSEANTLSQAIYSGELVGKAVAVFLGLN